MVVFTPCTQPAFLFFWLVASQRILLGISNFGFLSIIFIFWVFGEGGWCGVYSGFMHMLWFIDGHCQDIYIEFIILWILKYIGCVTNLKLKADQIGAFTSSWY